MIDNMKSLNISLLVLVCDFFQNTRNFMRGELGLALLPPSRAELVSGKGILIRFLQDAAELPIE